MSIDQGFARSTDRNGLTITTEVLWFSPDEQPRESLPPSPNTSRTVRPNGDGSYTVETSSYSVKDGPVVKEVAGYMTNEPIDTHPKFKTDIGGTPDAPLNGAQFDKDGVFVGFPPDSKYAGVTSYLAFGSSRTETQVVASSSVPVSNVGKLEGGELVTGFTTEVRGNATTVRKEWRGPGPRGWDTTIYKS